MVRFFYHEKEFTGKGRVQIQNDLFGQVAVQTTGESVSGNDSQVRRLKPDDAFGNAGQLEGCCLNRKLKLREIPNLSNKAVDN